MAFSAAVAAAQAVKVGKLDQLVQVERGDLQTGRHAA